MFIAWLPDLICISNEGGLCLRSKCFFLLKVSLMSHPQITLHSSKFICNALELPCLFFVFRLFPVKHLI